MEAILDRLCRVVEWACLCALIMLSYTIVANVINMIINANTQEQEMVIDKFQYYDWAEKMPSWERAIEESEGKVLGEYAPVTVMGKPDMFQLDVYPIVDVGFVVFVFLFLCYAVIYILNGKVRFLPWK